MSTFHILVTEKGHERLFYSMEMFIEKRKCDETPTNFTNIYFRLSRNQKLHHHHVFIVQPLYSFLVKVEQKNKT